MQARQLVAEHNLISVILHTFLEACEEKKSEFEFFFYVCRVLSSDFLNSLYEYKLYSFPVINTMDDKSSLWKLL